MCSDGLQSALALKTLAIEASLVELAVAQRTAYLLVPHAFYLTYCTLVFPSDVSAFLAAF